MKSQRVAKNIHVSYQHGKAWGRILRSHWPVSLTLSVNYRFSERLSQKRGGRGEERVVEKDTDVNLWALHTLMHLQRRKKRKCS